jgi:hypothetical protein
VLYGNARAQKNVDTQHYPADDFHYFGLQQITQQKRQAPSGEELSSELAVG